eukprot:6024358-Pyramimonas_sp.AAC.1
MRSDFRFVYRFVYRLPESLCVSTRAPRAERIVLKLEGPVCVNCKDRIGFYPCRCERSERAKLANANVKSQTPKRLPATQPVKRPRLNARSFRV